MPAKQKRPARPPCVVHPHAAGIDVGGAAHVVAVPADRDPQPIRTFGVFTADLRALAAWLKQCGGPHRERFFGGRRLCSAK